MPSGTSLPSRSSTASVVIRWPTWRMNSSERPRRVTLAAAGRGVGPVGVHRPGEGLAALGDLLGERAVHQLQPVAVADDLVLGVDGGDGVLEVHDRGDRGLEQQVLDPGGVGGADRVVAVDLDLDVQPVVHQQHGLGGRRPSPRLPTSWAGSASRTTSSLTVTARPSPSTAYDVASACEPSASGKCSSRKRPAAGDDLVAAHGVVAVARARGRPRGGSRRCRRARRTASPSGRSRRWWRSARSAAGRPAAGRRCGRPRRRRCRC